MLDPTKAGVATQTNPGTTEGSTGTSTLDNLEANVAAQIGGPEGIAPSAPAGATTEPEGTPAAGEPKAGEDAEAAAKAQRISQDNANLRATLIAAGIDPDSDTAEHLRTGLVTLDDIIRSKQPAPTVPAAAPKTDATASEVPLDQKLINLQNALAAQKGDVSAEQYRETQGKMIEVITGLVQANQSITQQRKIDANTQVVQGMIGAANDVFTKEVASDIPEDVREIASTMFLGATDLEHGAVEQQFGNAAHTPEHFRNTAAKVAPKVKAFVQAIYKAGAQAQLEAINKGRPTGGAVVNPLQPGTGSGSPPPPPAPGKYDIRNLNANVDEVLRSTQLQI